MKRKKIISLLLCMFILSISLTSMVYADTSEKDFISQKFDEMDQTKIEAEINSEIEKLNLNVIAEHNGQVLIKLTEEQIDKNKDILTSQQLASGVVYVSVSWKISYSEADGLGFYTTAYGPGALLTRMIGENQWYSSGYGLGAYEIRTVNTVPASRISNYVATGEYFDSGTIVDCSMYVDIDAVNEIAGGYYESSKIVTIP